MAYDVSLAELRRAGASLTVDEVVAIAEKLIQQPPDARPHPPFGPLAPERIRIASDGTISCVGCAVTPTVAELAILMQDLLASTPQVPGGLRYAIARALHEVDAPPFDSLEEFAAALQRYVPRHRDDTLRRLVARRDRRKPSRSTADLRLALREADRRLYESQRRTDVPAPQPRRARTWMVGALVAGALTTIAAASVVGDRPQAMPLPPQPPTASAPELVVPRSASEAHTVIGSAPRPHATRSRAVKPSVRDPRVHTIRLRWLRKTIAIKDDFAKP